MKHVIPAKNWHLEIADALEHAITGDEIVVRTDEQRQLAESARHRMCPGKLLFFVVEKDDDLYDWR